MRVPPLLLVVAITAGLLSVTVSATPAVRVSAGSLQARVSTNPWGTWFTDPAGKPVLNEYPGTGSGPGGTVGFRAAGSWRHATRVVSARWEGARYVAELATTDPQHHIEVRLAPRARAC